MIQRIGHEGIPAHIEVRSRCIEVRATNKPRGCMGYKAIDSFCHRAALPVGSKLGLCLESLPVRTDHVSAQCRKCSSTVAWRSE